MRRLPIIAATFGLTVLPAATVAANTATAASPIGQSTDYGKVQISGAVRCTDGSPYGSGAMTVGAEQGWLETTATSYTMTFWAVPDGRSEYKARVVCTAPDGYTELEFCRHRFANRTAGQAVTYKTWNLVGRPGKYPDPSCLRWWW
jgi:hypothetical protein